MLNSETFASKDFEQEIVDLWQPPGYFCLLPKAHALVSITSSSPPIGGQWGRSQGLSQKVASDTSSHRCWEYWCGGGMWAAPGFAKLHPAGSVPTPRGPTFTFLGVTDHSSSFRDWHGPADYNTAAALSGVGVCSVGSTAQDWASQCLHGRQAPQGKAKPWGQAARAGMPRATRGGQAAERNWLRRRKAGDEVLNPLTVEAGRPPEERDLQVALIQVNHLFNTYCVPMQPGQYQQPNLLAVGFHQIKSGSRLREEPKKWHGRDLSRGWFWFQSSH